MTITTPGIYPDMTAREYFAGATPTMALTSSGIKTLLNETPADFIGKKREATAAMRLGDVTHQLALGKGKGYVISPYDDYRTKDSREWRDAAIASGLVPIKQPDFDAAEAMAAIIRTRIEKALGGAEYLTEVPFFWQEGDVWCAGMMDVWCQSLGVVIDPKITGYVHGERARAHIANMGWHWQNAWYRRGLGKIMPEIAGRVRFANLLISDDEPHTSRLVEISEGWRTGAERDCERALATFAQCMATDTWPGYPDQEVIDEPTWLTNARLMRDMEDEE